MWELDHKEGWAPKNWCFWTVVLEKTLESSLDSRQIKPVNLKENQPWIFIGRTDTETEAPVLWPPDVKSLLIGKNPDARKDWGQEEKGWQGMRWLDGITDSMDMCLSKLWEIVKNQEPWRAEVPWGWRESGTTEQMNNNILAWEIPRKEKPSRLWSMGFQRVRHNLLTKQQQFIGYLQGLSSLEYKKALCNPYIVCTGAQSLSHIWLFAIPWTVAHQTPLSMGLSEQEYWSGLPLPPPGDLSNQELKTSLLQFLHWQVGFFTIEPPGKQAHILASHEYESCYTNILGFWNWFLSGLV